MQSAGRCEQCGMILLGTASSHGFICPAKSCSLQLYSAVGLQIVIIFFIQFERVPPNRAVTHQTEYHPTVLLPFTSGTMAEENETTPFFLDSFPKEVLNNVLRFFSRMRNANKWETHIDVQDLMELFAVRGELQIWGRIYKLSSTCGRTEWMLAANLSWQGVVNP